MPSRELAYSFFYPFNSARTDAEFSAVYPLFFKAYSELTQSLLRVYLEFT